MEENKTLQDYINDIIESEAFKLGKIEQKMEVYEYYDDDCDYRAIYRPAIKKFDMIGADLKEKYLYLFGRLNGMKYGDDNTLYDYYCDITRRIMAFVIRLTQPIDNNVMISNGDIFVDIVSLILYKPHCVNPLAPYIYISRDMAL